MPGFSGKLGTAKKAGTAIVDITTWNFTPLFELNEYMSNLTNGRKARIVAGGDSSGSFECLADSAGNAPVREGEQLVLQLHVDDTGLNYYEVQALVSDVPISSDVTGGANTAFTVNFAENGGFTRHGILQTTQEASSSSSSGA